jgi:hypothetical protein
MDAHMSAGNHKIIYSYRTRKMGYKCQYVQTNNEEKVDASVVDLNTSV